jgi:lipopolysaccharide/colanic/teichoic acid biosynthesis glycosyltransferase
MDVMLAGVVLVVGAPVIAGVAACIRWRMGSPILFRQARAGKHGRTFMLIKFRTMRAPRADEQGFRPDTDEQRLTRLGRFLRATSLDELPTMVNVLRGEMSVVGPRPLPVHYLPRYSDHHARRHEVRPGITGWAQVHGRNALSWDEQLDMDVWYVDHRSLRLDLRILGRTAATVLRRDGISQNGQATREEFSGSGAATT